MVKNTHGKGGLSKFLVCHYAVWLKTLILSRTHTRKIHRIFGAPIVFLQVTQMVRHHGDIGAPLLFKTNKNTHAYGGDTSLTHTVKSVASPVKLALHAVRMVQIIVLTVIGLLKTYNPVKSVMREFFILFCFQRHNFYLDIRKIPFCNIYCSGKVFYARLCRMLARNKQYIFKRRQFLYGLILILYLLRSQNSASHWILSMKAAIHA